MIFDLVLEQQNYLSQQSSIDITSTDAHPLMPITSTDIPSTDTHYSLTVSSSMDILSTSNSTLSENNLFALGTTFDEQLVITTLLGLE